MRPAPPVTPHCCHDQAKQSACVRAFSWQQKVLLRAVEGSVALDLMACRPSC